MAVAQLTMNCSSATPNMYGRRLSASGAQARCGSGARRATEGVRSATSGGDSLASSCGKRFSMLRGGRETYLCEPGTGWGIGMVMRSVMLRTCILVLRQTKLKQRNRVLLWTNNKPHMPSEYDVVKTPKQQRHSFRRQYAYAPLSLAFLVLTGIFIVINCFIISDGCAYATFGFIALAVVFFCLYVYEKFVQWSLEATLENQGQMRKPQGFLEHFWKTFMPGEWVRPIAVSKPGAQREIQMSGLPDVERPLPVSMKARY